MEGVVPPPLPVVLASTLAECLLSPFRTRHLGRWLPSYIWDSSKRRSPGDGDEVHLLIQFHEMLAQYASLKPNFHYHYVMAREMLNLVHAAAHGWQGSVVDARRFRFAALSDGGVAPCIASRELKDSPLLAGR